MTDESSTPITPVEEPKKKNTLLIVIVIAVVVLMLIMICCCASLILAWNYGDQALWQIQSWLGY